jgi:predicted transcriptional regulator
MTREKRTMVVTIRLGETTVKGLRELADADRRKLASYLSMVLEDHLAEKQTQTEKPKGGRKP